MRKDLCINGKKYQVNISNSPVYGWGQKSSIWRISYDGIAFVGGDYCEAFLAFQKYIKRYFRGDGSERG